MTPINPFFCIWLITHLISLILFFNDNGGSPRFGSSNLPLKGQKGSVDEGGIRVRAFARWPEMLKPATTSHQFMWVGDLFPTLTAAAGIELPDSLKQDGMNMWNAIKSDLETSRPEFVMGNGNLAVFRPPWKLIIPANDGDVTLYDVVKDPYEKNDLSGKHAELVAELNNIAQEMIAIAEVSPADNIAAQAGGPRGGGPRTGQGRRDGQGPRGGIGGQGRGNGPRAEGGRRN